MSGTLPTVMTTAGLQPQAPAALLAQLLALVAASNPGYTASLPGSLIEDISSTDVGAIVLCDQARVELVNSISPNTANPFILTQLGNVYGVTLTQATNTGAVVVFTGTVGFVINAGFTISDGLYQYTVQDGGIIGTGGVSTNLTVVATQPGSWAIPVGTITQIVTSVPSGITLSVTNPLVGTPGAATQTESDFRAAVVQAGQAIATGTSTLLKTALGNIAGTQARLIAARLITGQWEIIVGGSADPYQIAFAIFSTMGAGISTLTGSTMTVTGITQANPGVVTTGLNHGYTTGQVCQINGATGMTAINGVSLTATVLSPTTFSIGVNTSGYGAYTGNGVLTPNFRNQTVSINQYPDTYVIPYVIPPQQTVTATVTWNTTLTGYIAASVVAGLAQNALSAYINTIPVGAPINTFELTNVFQAAVVNVIPTPLITRLLFAIYINGFLTAPTSGTGVIAGDPESYFYTTAASITVNQG